MRKSEQKVIIDEMLLESQKEKSVQTPRLTQDNLVIPPGMDTPFPDQLLQEASKHLLHFFKTIDNDPRISVTHISLYCTVFKLGLEQKVQPILIMAPELMKSAKISGLGTYHRCIRELHNFGYIKYEPSFNHRKKSKIYLLDDTCL